MNHHSSQPADLAQHTFGRDHFTPPPTALELAPPSAAAVAALADPQDLDERIRNVGEW